MKKRFLLLLAVALALLLPIATATAITRTNMAWIATIPATIEWPAPTVKGEFFSNIPIFSIIVAPWDLGNVIAPAVPMTDSNLNAGIAIPSEWQTWTQNENQIFLLKNNLSTARDVPFIRTRSSVWITWPITYGCPVTKFGSEFRTAMAKFDFHLPGRQPYRLRV